MTRPFSSTAGRMRRGTIFLEGKQAVVLKGLKNIHTADSLFSIHGMYPIETRDECKDVGIRMFIATTSIKRIQTTLMLSIWHTME